MNTATPLTTHTKDGVTQTTYELSEWISYTRLNGVTYQTRYVIVSHAQHGEIDETAVFPSTRSGEVLHFEDLYMTAPACDNATALAALGFTPTP